MTAKEFFSSLIGLTIEEACKRLGRWWVLDSSRSNWPNGWHGFYRAAGGRVELKTEFKDGRNEVVGESHNLRAEFYQKRDL